MRPGSLLNDQTIPRLRVDEIAEVVNYQPAMERHVDEAMVRRVDGIKGTISEILKDAARDRMTTLRAAEMRAAHVLESARKDGS